MKSLICHFTDGLMVKVMLFKAKSSDRCLALAANWQSKHQLVCLSMKFS